MKRGRRLAQTMRGRVQRRWANALFIYGDRRILYPWVLSGQAARGFALLDAFEAEMTEMDGNPASDFQEAPGEPLSPLDTEVRSEARPTPGADDARPGRVNE